MLRRAGLSLACSGRSCINPLSAASPNSSPKAISAFTLQKPKPARKFSVSRVMAEEPQMEYVNLGQSGLKVAKVIVGAMSFGDPRWQEWVLDEEKALPLLEHAYKKGLRTWDTADIYSHGRSEEIIGKAIKHYNLPREKLVILTKCYFGVSTDGTQPNIGAVASNAGENLNRVGLSRKHIMDAVEASTRRLGTYIDVLQIHRLDRSTPRAEIMRALHDVVESGRARYIGASSMWAWEFQALQSLADARGWHRFVSMQDYYNLLYREEEREMIPYCNDAGVALIPWSPIARGVLARPWAVRDSHREKTDGFLHRQIRSRETDVDKAIVDRVEDVARRRGVPMATIATAWCIKKGTMPIVGLNSIERIDQAVESAKYQLSDEDAKYLEEPYMPKVTQGF